MLNAFWTFFRTPDFHVYIYLRVCKVLERKAPSYYSCKGTTLNDRERFVWLIYVFRQIQHRREKYVWGATVMNVSFLFLQNLCHADHKHGGMQQVGTARMRYRTYESRLAWRHAFQFNNRSSENGMMKAGARCALLSLDVLPIEQFLFKRNFNYMRLF